MRLKLARPGWRTAIGAVLAFGLGAAVLTAPATATAAVTGADVAPSVAKRIDLVTTGGLVGRREHKVVDTDNPRREAVAALRLASTPEFRALDPTYPPSRPCCDRFRYVVTVAYSDGASKQVVTWDGAPAPEVLWTVIRLSRISGVPVPVRPPAPVPAL